MALDDNVSPVPSTSPAGPTRRALLALLGTGALGGTVAGLAATLDPVAAGKGKGGKKKKGGKGKGKGGKGKGGGKNRCNGSVNGSASPTEEEALRQMINTFRAQQQPPLQPLARQAQLDSAAAAHSRDMATRCYFDHVSPGGANPFQRMAAAGYPGVPLAENIYKGSGNLGSAAQAFDAWKNSSGHRTNMLDPRASHIGIGTALDGSGFMTWTNVFGRPRDI